MSKIVYFSPRFAGFDFAASFAPNNGANNAAACPVASAGCVALSSANNASFGGAARPTNWYEFMGRYRATSAVLASMASPDTPVPVMSTHRVHNLTGSVLAMQVWH